MFVGIKVVLIVDIVWIFRFGFFSGLYINFSMSL